MEVTKISKTIKIMVFPRLNLTTRFLGSPLLRINHVIDLMVPNGTNETLLINIDPDYIKYDINSPYLLL